MKTKYIFALSNMDTFKNATKEQAAILLENCNIKLMFKLNNKEEGKK